MSSIELKLERIKQGRRQLEVARAIGIHPTRLSKIENGWEQARPGEIAALCRELGLTDIQQQQRGQE